MIPPILINIGVKEKQGNYDYGHNLMLALKTHKPDYNNVFISHKTILAKIYGYSD